MQMGTGKSDTQPDRHVNTDPGLGVAVAEHTDPGVAPPPSAPRALEVVADVATPPPPVFDRSAPTPVAPLVDSAPARPNPRVVVRRSGDTTPVPPEADGLLSGLLASENEAYFRKTKVSAESGGEAAAAFHGRPHAVAPGNPTPPPEPAVLLRRSVDLEIEDVKARVRATTPLADTDPSGSDALPARDGTEGTQGDADPRPPRAYVERAPDPTLPLLPEPRSPWTDKAIAFGLAALAVGSLGVILVRWLAPAGPPESSAVTQAPAPEAPPPATRATATAAPVEPAAHVEPAAPAAQPAPVANATASGEPAAPESSVQRASGRPQRSSTNPAAKRTTPQGAAPDPGEVAPPPKDDVKRSM